MPTSCLVTGHRADCPAPTGGWRLLCKDHNHHHFKVLLINGSVQNSSSVLAWTRHGHPVQGSKTPALAAGRPLGEDVCTPVCRERQSSRSTTSRQVPVPGPHFIRQPRSKARNGNTLETVLLLRTVDLLSTRLGCNSVYFHQLLAKSSGFTACCVHSLSELIILRRLENITLLVVTRDNYRGLPWWLRSKESACQGRRHRFDPRSGKIPCATQSS